MSSILSEIDQIYDLLDQDRLKAGGLDLRELGDKSITVAGLKVVTIRTFDEYQKLHT